MPDMISFQIPASTKVKFITIANGEVGYLKLSEGRLSLLRGRVYKLPVNTRSALDEFNVLKIAGKIREVLDVRNIENGFATVIPIVHNTLITDGMEFGFFI